YALVEEAAALADDHGGAGAGAAGQGFAAATLVDAQADMVAADDLHEADVDALGEVRVRFQCWPHGGHRRGINVFHQQGAVWIAEADGADLVGVVVGHQQVGIGLDLGVHRDLRRGPARRTHVDGDLAIVGAVQGHLAGGGLDADIVQLGEALFAHEAGETACAVAALAYFRAVGIEDAVAEIDAALARRLHHQQLVETDAEMAIGQAAALHGGQRQAVRRQRLAYAVEDDEVVAEAVHLGETQFHADLRVYSK